jgi:hypothetical protein
MPYDVKHFNVAVESGTSSTLSAPILQFAQSKKTVRRNEKVLSINLFTII